MRDIIIAVAISWIAIMFLLAYKMDKEDGYL
jgi:hypothetical protein